MKGLEGTESLMKAILEKLRLAEPAFSEDTSGQSPNGPDNKSGLLVLTPAKLLVITGLITNALQVNSITIDKDQSVDIVLSGSLERPTPADKALEQMGSMSFDEVLAALFKRFG